MFEPNNTYISKSAQRRKKENNLDKYYKPINRGYPNESNGDKFPYGSIFELHNEYENKSPKKKPQKRNKKKALSLYLTSDISYPFESIDDNKYIYGDEIEPPHEYLSKSVQKRTPKRKKKKNLSQQYNNNNNIVDKRYTFESNENNYLYERIYEPYNEYVSKSAKRRTPKRKKIIDFPKNYKDKRNTFETNNVKFPHQFSKEIQDKNNIELNLDNLDNTFSSVDSTNNHFTLIEETNEIRNPSNFTINPINKDTIKMKKIRSLLSPSFEILNLNDDSQQNLLTDRILQNNNKFQNSLFNESSIYDSLSRSQKRWSKNKMFTVSIPINIDKSNVEYKNDNIYEDNKKIKNNKQKRSKEITLDNSNSSSIFNKYSNNADKNNNINYSKYMKTPSKDFYINWEEGNSTCPTIIKNEINQDKINYTINDYKSLTNKGRNNKKKHYKCKSAIDYIPGNKDSFINANYINNIFDYNRKKLVY